MEWTSWQAPSLRETNDLLSPSLVVFPNAVERNIDRMLAIAGEAERLRPHCKTHKMAAVTRLQVAKGILKHKCATFAEAEMLGEAGATDVFLAYNIVGPNIPRVVKYVQTYPHVAFSVTADDAQALQALETALKAASISSRVGVFLDLDTGLHRTGLGDRDRAAQLYQRLVQSQYLEPRGFHLYDGHNHQTSVDERRSAVLAGWEQARTWKEDFVARGWPVPTVVCGGTGSFPIFASLTDPAVELSPGTCIFHDQSYASTFPDLDFEPALWILTRVISRPTDNRVTLDVGNKAVAADPPRGNRLYFPDLPDAVQVLHNEEHLVLETPAAAKYRPGDVLLAVPRHVCPTSALHRWVYVAQDGQVFDRWEVTARDRQLTI